MSAWGKRQNRSNPHGARLGFESLERREMLAADYVYTLTSGNTVSFKDADGTTVKVKLMGSGSGNFTLTNGLKTGAPIAAMTITGTDNASQLKITAAGGGDDVSTIRSLTVTPTIPGPALTKFNTTAINVATGGLLTFNGGVGFMTLNNVNNGGAIVVNGDLNSFIVNSVGSNSSIDVSGTLSSLKVKTLGTGSGLADVDAQTLTSLSVTGQMNDALVNVGSGGMLTAYIGSATNSAISSAGNIGNVVVQGAIQSTGIAANRSAGSDGILGTIDDYTINSSAAGLISSVAFNGAVIPGANGVQVITTGAAPTIAGPNKAQAEVYTPSSQFIPLQIAQAVANATGFDDDEIWLAVFGQEIVTPAEGVTPPPGISYFLDAAQLNSAGAGGQPTPIPISTATLPVGVNTPDQAILPSSTISAWANGSSPWGSNLQFPVPRRGHQFTGRIVISVGAPIQAQVSSPGGTVAAPSASNSADPSNGTFYDFLEFTVTNKNGVPHLDVDTSQVDSFGLPMTLQFFQDVLQTPFTAVFTGTATASSATITNISSMANLNPGQYVTGAGIPGGAQIASVDPTSSSITLNMAALPSASGVPEQLSSVYGGPVGVDGTRNEILDGANSNSLLAFLENQLGLGYENARPFFQSAAPFEISGAVPITGSTSSGLITVYTDSASGAGLLDNDIVYISGVQGNTAANGVFTVTQVTANSFQLVGSNGNGAYKAGGAWSRAITGASNPGPGQPIVITASSLGNLQNGDLVEISGVAGNTAANGFFFVSNKTGTTFTLDGSDGAGAAYTSGGTWRVYASGPRLVSPKDVVESLPSAASDNQLNNYFNEAIDAFFLKYLPADQSVVRDGITYHGGGETCTIYSSASGTNLPYSGTVNHLTGLGHYLFLTNSASPTPFAIFYPFTNTTPPGDYTPLFPTVPAQPWMTDAAQSASQMIFACDGYFADNIMRYSYPPNKSLNLTTTWSAILGDLEDSIAAAFNRGIALNDPGTWGDQTTWFKQNNDQNGKYNYWVEYWHNSGLAVNGLAYAFPYDDKYGSSTNLNVKEVGLAQVLLNAWSNLQQPTTTTFLNFPSTAQQQGMITLTANVGPPVNPNPLNGTITFFIDGVAINSNDFSSAPPQQPIPVDGSGNATITARLPALPDGSTTHTYTVTAVYSGDQYTAPSIAYQPLKLTGVNGDFLMTYQSTGAPTTGSPITISGTLPGGVYDGTLTLSIAHPDGSHSQELTTINVGSANFSTTVTIPAALASLTPGLFPVTGLFTPRNGGPYTGLMGINLTS